MFSVLHYLYENCAVTGSLCERLSVTEVFDYGTWEVILAYIHTSQHVTYMSQTCHSLLNVELTVFQHVSLRHTFFIKVKYILIYKELM